MPNFRLGEFDPDPCQCPVTLLTVEWTSQTMMINLAVHEWKMHFSNVSLLIIHPPV
jgi:hypothetical protein